MAAKQNKTLIVIAGPTAAGKTDVAIQLAEHFKTEIISADSRQIFRELSIGTAKPGKAELALVRHHFINSHSIHEKYDAAQFAIDAQEKIEVLFKQYDYLVLCGGSGLYIKALLDGFDDIPEVDPDLRQYLIRQYEELGLAWLQQQMLEHDPVHYASIDQLNPHRLIRALEVKLGTGSSISEYQKQKRKIHFFNILKIGLELPREQLYNRINTRMDKMIEAGLFEEAKEFYDLREHNALQTVGYQEIFGFMEGRYDYTETVRLLKQNTRRYAKRQLTWFKKDPDTRWFQPDQVSEMIAFIEEVKTES
jgi:tRNA dimethylallyltransferase